MRQHCCFAKRIGLPLLPMVVENGKPWRFGVYEFAIVLKKPAGNRALKQKIEFSTCSIGWPKNKNKFLSLCPLLWEIV